MSKIEKFILSKYCTNCHEEKTIGDYRGMFYVKLELENHEEDKKIIEKSYFGFKTTEKIIEGLWVLYKCPKCSNRVKFVYNEEKKDWVEF